MRRRRWFPAILLSTCLLSVGGCEQYYTGGLGLADADQAVAGQYAAKHHLGKAEAQAPARPSTTGDRPQAMASTGLRPMAPGPGEADPAAAPFDNHQLPGDPLGPALTGSRVPNMPADLSPGSLARMNLFGQLTSRRQPLGRSAADNARQITFSTIGADFDPQVSPDGKRIVYASTSHSRTSDIYIKKVGSTAITQLTNDPSNDVMPTFSPDGKRIAFCSDRSGNWDIYVMNVIGGQAVQITDDPSDELHPSFSPDGRYLVYCSYGSATNRWELVVVDLRHPAIKHLIGRGLFPVWSPNGKQILFQRARQRGTRWFSVWTVDYADGQATSPTELASSANAAVITPAWSADGKHIVFCTVTDPAADNQPGSRTADIWVMNADGSGRARLTNGQFMNLEPTWAGDGTIYFVSNRGGHGIETIWALSPKQALSLAARSSNGAKTTN